MGLFSRIFGGGKSAAATESPDDVDWPIITPVDFEALLAEEAAGVKGWTEVKNEKNIKVWKNQVCDCCGSVELVCSFFESDSRLCIPSEGNLHSPEYYC